MQYHAAAAGAQPVPDRGEVRRLGGVKTRLARLDGRERRVERRRPGRQRRHVAEVVVRRCRFEGHGQRALADTGSEAVAELAGAHERRRSEYLNVVLAGARRPEPEIEASRGTGREHSHPDLRHECHAAAAGAGIDRQALRLWLQIEGGLGAQADHAPAWVEPVPDRGGREAGSGSGRHRARLVRLDSRERRIEGRGAGGERGCVGDLVVRRRGKERHGQRAAADPGHGVGLAGMRERGRADDLDEVLLVVNGREGKVDVAEVERRSSGPVRRSKLEPGEARAGVDQQPLRVRQAGGEAACSTTPPRPGLSRYQTDVKGVGQPSAPDSSVSMLANDVSNEAVPTQRRRVREVVVRRCLVVQDRSDALAVARSSRSPRRRAVTANLSSPSGILSPLTVT